MERRAEAGARSDGKSAGDTVRSADSRNVLTCPNFPTVGRHRPPAHAQGRPFEEHHRQTRPPADAEVESHPGYFLAPDIPGERRVAATLAVAQSGGESEVEAGGFQAPAADVHPHV